jgi:hypothetical protein
VTHADFVQKRSKRASFRIETPEPVVRIEVPPGSEGQVDFGYAGLTIDPRTGAEGKTWVFVLVLSWSRHLYAERRAAHPRDHERTAAGAFLPARAGHSPPPTTDPIRPSDLEAAAGLP